MFTQGNVLSEDQQIRLKELRKLQDDGKTLTDAEREQLDQLEEAEKNAEKTDVEGAGGPTNPAKDYGDTHKETPENTVQRPNDNK